MRKLTESGAEGGACTKHRTVHVTEKAMSEIILLIELVEPGVSNHFTLAIS